ncbi:ParB/RepB/Spo0J family partition protein [Streptomyces caniscabiei]|uniref:ParB N-terminal domain-containing protein n=1 Tax=Streptomyces caniscabiei TaxID=2746961 RepID=A0ABU4N262_9ACTN|nr:ParB N-terminal domain-containing protein [Streptomyces caniscabiei]MBE4790304.1 hypothetical protein [Streptomyces caniscabiei]MBE4799467.1 hypothetical protein [Streptomyces caniscabiei]MDX3015161.1 ParB N-terminal domain-containing protein [Streptomyces caniscabiei]MDX3042604.1 ParB N-terminal domain-containing protein [Streptomyces caniscabiei]
MAPRDDFDDFFGDDDDTPVIDTRADGRLYRVPVGRLAANLVNPRTDFGTEDQLIDLGKSLSRRQNQACPVVSRGAYLKLWPDHDDRIGDIDYVLVSGERRFRAANAVGLLALDCVVNDDVAADRRTFMEAVVSENVDRQNFDPIEEAYAVQALVSEFGTNRAVAQHFDRVDGWVTQRVLLTHLHPTMQDLVRKKAMPLEAARKLGKLARDGNWDEGQQAAWWEQEQDRRATVAQARSEAKNAAPGPVPAAAPASAAAPADAEAGEASFTAVKPSPSVPKTAPAASAPAALEGKSFTAVKPQGPPATSDEPQEAMPTSPERVPEPRSVQNGDDGRPDSLDGQERRQTKMPWGDGDACADIIIAKMARPERQRLIDRLLEYQRAEREQPPVPARAG